MNDDDVTAQIMEAWDEVVADDERDENEEPEATTVVEEPEPGDDEEEESEEGEDETADDETADDADEEEGDEEEDGDEPAQEEEEPTTPDLEDVEVRAFLAKYGGDQGKALKAAADLQRVLGRQGSEKAAALARVEELERELAAARALGAGASLLSEEQRMWVDTAAESPNPAVYVQQAMQAGEFELARAVCREWAQTNPFDAQRIGQFIDATEQEVVRAQTATEVPPTETWAALAEHYPELRQYEAAMVETLQRMGPDHPSVQEARSTDPSVAVRGIMHIFDVAKASTFALSDARAGVKKRRRKEADDAADNAAVTSGAARPSTSETPRPRRLMPGLTEEDLDKAFEAEFASQ